MIDWVGFVGLFVAIAMMFASLLWMVWRWRQLERWVVAKIRYHERLAANADYVYEKQLHLAQVKALDEALIVMEELERGRRADWYQLRLATRKSQVTARG